MNRLIIVGSPRPNGRSAALADLLFESCIAECPDDEVALAPVSTLSIAPCEGCDACRALVERQDEAPEDSSAGDSAEDGDSIRCIIDDDMAEIYPLMDAADELVIVSPVYFAGAPAQFKALLDRLQPYYWAGARLRPKRPATLHVVGEGGDPHGFDPLVSVVRSALSCAGFRLERVLDWVGRIDADGEITADAVEHPIPPLPGGTATSAGENGAAAASKACAGTSDGPHGRMPRTEAPCAADAPRERPVLRVAAEDKPSKDRAEAGGSRSADERGGKREGDTARSGRPDHGPSSKQGSPKGEGRTKQGGSPGKGGPSGRSGSKRNSHPKRNAKSAKQAHSKRSSGRYGG